MLALFADPQAWLAFITLALLEIVLGIDNLIFIAILVGRLPEPRRDFGRIAGLSLAMLTRIALLFSIVWLTRLVQPWFHVAGLAVTGRDVILFAGGLFLLVKSVLEIHQTMEGAAHGLKQQPRVVYSRLLPTVIQIAVIDIVFSLDSVFTAVGLAKDLPIMVAAIIVAILVMMWVSRAVGAFIERHPTIKLLALAFLILIGAALVSEAVHLAIPKGYLYFAMAFSVGVELINMRVRRRTEEQRNAGPGGKPG
ncbi:MAG TPA: TerC family protein [Steroidobacteraceae bacterium]|jgi:predicted tellurium resistance membrane protein TerC